MGGCTEYHAQWRGAISVSFLQPSNETVGDSPPPCVQLELRQSQDYQRVEVEACLTLHDESHKTWVRIHTDGVTCPCGAIVESRSTKDVLLQLRLGVSSVLLGPIVVEVSMDENLSIPQVSYL